MGGEYCTCNEYPEQECPICRITKNNLCSCGCGYEVGSADFQRIHVNQQEEDNHGQFCFCTRCDG